MSPCEKTKTLYVFLPPGDIFTEKGQGIFSTSNYGAICRLDALMQRLDLNHEDPLIICTAGYSKENPLQPGSDREVSLAIQFKRYVYQYYRYVKDCVHAEPLGWGTETEILNAIEIASRHFFKTGNGVTVIYIASCAWHLPRVWVYAQIYAPLDARIELIRVKHPFSVWSCIRELTAPIVQLNTYIHAVVRSIQRRRMLKSISSN